MICINADCHRLEHAKSLVNDSPWINQPTSRSEVMTDHILSEHSEEDKTIMRRLALVVGFFMLGTAAMALSVAALAG